MTRFSMSLSFVLAIAACGGSHKPAPMTGGVPPPSNAGGTPTTTGAPSSAAWVDDASMCSNHPDELGPWNLTADQMGKRYGTGVTALASIATTKEHPIELCSVPAENTWLASSTCADGSHPYKSPDDVEASRAGNVGPGGRCGGIIDLYKATCPEKTYDVYIDMNLCGPGESFMP
jgi:hypothetical protein